MGATLTEQSVEMTPEQLKSYISKPILYGQEYSSRSAMDVVRLSRPLTYLCTEYPVKNKDPLRNFIKLDKKTIGFATEMASRAHMPSTAQGPFHRMILRFAEYQKYRIANELESVIVLEPPPLSHIGAWELAFSGIGLKVAWLDENGEAHQSAISPDAAHLNRKAISQQGLRGSKEESMIAALAAGESCVFKVAFVTQTPIQRSNHKNVFKRTCEAISKEFGDRYFSVKETARHKRDGDRARGLSLVITRLTDDEYMTRKLSLKNKTSFKKAQA